MTDYTDPHDYSGDTPDYSDMSNRQLKKAARAFPDQDALNEDLFGDGYEQKSFGENFRDKYQENMKALSEAEKSEGGAGKTSQRDIGKQERGAKNSPWETNFKNFENKLGAIADSAKNKSNGLLA